jgi:serine/threonine-protein kinase
MPDPLIGRTLAGKYRIVELLGEGGMGAVYVGEQTLGTTSRKVAVKTLHAHLSRDEKIRARFERECATMVGLQHPNTVQVIDFGTTDDGLLYLVMEFVSGRSIASALEAEGAMRPERVSSILEQIGGSLSEAHAQGIIHRDLKPDNVILTDRAGKKDFVKVLDFGIAKRNEDDQNVPKLTQQGMVLGTPPYMSPEQFTGQPLDARSDIYSLAVMAYEMLTGVLPFDAANAYEWATLHMTAAPKAIEATPNGAALPESMRAAIMRALAKTKEQRFDTVADFVARFTGKASASAAEVAQRKATAVHNDPSRAPAAAAPAAAAAFAPAPAPAAAQAPAAGQALKGKTQIGEPLAIPPDAFSPPAGGYGPPPGGTAMGAPMGAMGPVASPAVSAVAAPYAPNPYAAAPSAGVAPPPARSGDRRGGGGGNKGLLVGGLLGAAALCGVLIAWGAGAFDASGSNAAVLPLPTETTPGGAVAIPTTTPTEPPQTSSGNVAPLTTQPTPPLTPPPSQPTPKPTAKPTAPPAPTPTPTPAPTPHPTTPPPAPTPTPTPHPTPAPTPHPTPAPTPHPTPAPTPHPTPAGEPLVCQQAKAARSRGSPAARSLEAQCRAVCPTCM